MSWSFLFLAVGQLLWQNIQTGMTQEEVVVLYPDERTLLTPDCQAKVDVRYEHGRSSAVTLISPSWYYGNGNKFRVARQCQEVIYRSILSRYGNPSDVQAVGGKDAHTVELFRSGEIAIVVTNYLRKPRIDIRYEIAPPEHTVRPEAAKNL